MSSRSSLGYRVRHCLKGKKEKKPNNTNKKNNTIKEVTILAMACDPAPPRPRPSPRPPAHRGDGTLWCSSPPPSLPSSSSVFQQPTKLNICNTRLSVGRAQLWGVRRGGGDAVVSVPPRGGLVLSVRGLRFSPSLSFLVLSFVVAFELCFCLVLTLLLNSPKLRQ